jgi:hypothetical protein
VRGLFAIASLAILVLLSTSGCGVQFATLTLGDQYKRPDSGDAMKRFGARTVYANTTGDEVWGPDACGGLQIGAEGAYEGNAIRVHWDKTPECDWVGMGIGWDAWQPKDLSGILEGASLEFQMRATRGESRVPIMVFLLEDYAETKSAAPLRAGYMERYPLDDTWRKVTLPLSDFPAIKDGLDLTNIKQLIVELQGSGDVMLDDMRIVPRAAASGETPSALKPSITPLGTLPVVLFEGQLPNAWGLERNDCRDFSLDPQGLRLSWWGSCAWSDMGFSWNRWLGVDLGSAAASAELVIEGDFGDIQGELLVGLEDYSGQRALVNLAARAPSGSGTLRIPLSECKLDARGVNPGNIKHFIIDIRGRGEALLRSIRLESPR